MWAGAWRLLRPRSGEVSVVPLEGVRILLVTRDRPVHDRIRTFCSQIAPTFRGLEWAGSYRAALAALETEGVDICVVDTALFNGAGMSFLQEPSLRRRRVPVVLLLDHPPRPDEDPLDRAGVADWIVKEDMDLPSFQRALRHARRGRDVTERVRTERERGKEKAELEGRIRTLETLLGVGTALRTPGLPLDRRLERIAGIVCQEGVLADRSTDARIVLHGKEFQTRGFEASAHTHSIPIRSGDGEVGVLEVVVSGDEGSVPGADASSMAELLERIARELGTIAPRRDDPQH